MRAPQPATRGFLHKSRNLTPPRNPILPTLRGMDATEHRTRRVRIRFGLPAEHGWAPSAAEWLWAEEIAAGTYTILNAPFFQYDIGVGDIVEAREQPHWEDAWDPFFRGPEEPHHLHYAGLAVDGRHDTFRAVVLQDGAFEGDPQRASDCFHGFGLWVEGASWFPNPMFALDVPPDADLDAVVALLERHEREGAWMWEWSKRSGR